jgi:hypothetical protein
VVWKDTSKLRRASSLRCTPVPQANEHWAVTDSAIQENRQDVFQYVY